ncbi:hypothetical protein SAMN04488502_10553 [Dendrosporobacter quercicolus]|uniref:Uncharacterized protein n=1 Tax=Dendrosporobacter quercicolus TaxID=146817 RepID=A0A1G9TQN5_9FIRM|nr:hypothetical protein SAMN04488502_10553 [Dendrosporobacter quercicolus]
MNGFVYFDRDFDRFELLGKSIDDREIHRRIMQYTNGSEPHESGSWKSQARYHAKKIKEAGLVIRQIERVTGIFRALWQNVDKKGTSLNVP